MSQSEIKYSVFAPIYNEQGNILPLYQQIKEVMEKLDGNWELILINDGSTDDSLQEILSIKDKRVRPIALEKNYGQSVAMDCGFRYVRGEIIITLDADLQNDPSEDIDDDGYTNIEEWIEMYTNKVESGNSNLLNPILFGELSNVTENISPEIEENKTITPISDEERTSSIKLGAYIILIVITLLIFVFAIYILSK